MYKFIPESVLLTDVYVPHHVPLHKHSYTLADFTLDVDDAGTASIINLNSKNIVPFIDMTKYDPDSRDFFWYDISGFPFSYDYQYSWDGLDRPGTLAGTFTGLTLKSIYPVDIFNFSPSGFYVDINFKNTFVDLDSPHQLGVTVSGVVYRDNYLHQVGDKKFYSAAPLMVAIDDAPLKDVTDYSRVTRTSSLTQNNVEANPEFYYNFQQNRIHTNQNLTSFDPTRVKVRMYMLAGEVEVKARLKSNGTGDYWATPVVDYYLVKLNGQFFGT